MSTAPQNGNSKAARKAAAARAAQPAKGGGAPEFPDAGPPEPAAPPPGDEWAPPACHPGDGPSTAARAFPTKPPTPLRYRVTRGGKASLWGHITHIPEGEVLTLGGYGVEGLRRLREQGIELEALP